MWSLLLMSGYLTSVTCEDSREGTRCVLRVPNREVNNLYRQILSSWLSNGYGLDWYNRFIRSLVTGQYGDFSSRSRESLITNCELP